MIDDPQEEAKFVVERIVKYSPDAFANYFGVSHQLPFREILLNIAQKRGKIRSIKKRKKRGWAVEDEDSIEARYDLDEAARIVLREFTNAKFIYYETPE